MSVLTVKQCFDQLLSQDGRWSADNRRQMDPFRDIDCYNPSPYRIVSFPSQLNFSFISLNDSRFSVHFHINDRILCCQSHSYDLYPGTYWGQGVLHVQGWKGGWGGAFLGSHYIAAGRRGILGTSKRSLVRSRLLGYVEVTLSTIKINVTKPINKIYSPILFAFNQFILSISIHTLKFQSLLNFRELKKNN